MSGSMRDWLKQFEKPRRKWKWDEKQVARNMRFVEETLFDWVPLPKWGSFLYLLSIEDTHDTMKEAAQRLLRKMRKAGYKMPREVANLQPVEEPSTVLW